MTVNLEINDSPSASTSGFKKPAVGKTPLERMYQVAALARRARLIRQLARGVMGRSRTVCNDGESGRR